MKPTPDSRPSPIVGVELLLLALCLHLWDARILETQADDAYVSYRYAVNLVQGHGLVFNVGERVEGITNLLWTLLLAAGEAFSVALPVMAHVLGAVCGAGMLILTFLLCRSQLNAQHAWLAGLATLALWTSSAFWVWVLSGLETSLFAMLVVAAFYAQSRHRYGWASIVCTLATLTRPEGLLVAVAIFGVQLWRQRSNPKAFFATPANWLPMVFFGASLVALTAFRLAYYGAPLPNTFYAKVGGIPLSRGVAYVGEFFRDGAVWLLPAMAVLVWSRIRKWPAPEYEDDEEPLEGMAAPFVFAVLFIAYAIYVGGDVFPQSRFLLPVLPLLLVICCAGMSAAFAWRASLAGVLVTALVAATIWPLIGLATTRESMKVRNWASNETVQAQADHLLQMQPPVKLVATVAIGRLGYFSGLPILDLLGLADAHIARAPISAALQRGEGVLLPGHQRSDPQYVLDRKPDVIMIPQKTAEPGLYLPATLDLWASPEFEAAYEWDGVLGGYVRRQR